MAKEFREYPKMFYGPGGQTAVVNEGEKPPKGFKDHPSKVADAAEEEDTNTADQLKAARQRIAELESEIARLRSGNQRTPGEEEQPQTGPKESRVARVPDQEDDPEYEEEVKRFKKEAVATLKAMNIDADESWDVDQLQAALDKIGR